MEKDKKKRREGEEGDLFLLTPEVGSNQQFLFSKRNKNLEK